MNVKTLEKLDTKRVFSLVDFSKYDFSEGNAPEEIQILGCGKWNHPQYGPIVIEPRDITEFKDNFYRGLRRDICITEGHETMDEKPAIGWIKTLIDRGTEGLFATMEWTKQGKTLLAEKQYKYFSPEFYSEYEDPETREIYENVLVGGALTNKPYFKSLKAVMLSEHGIKNPSYQFNYSNNMELKDIVIKSPGELTPEEQAFLRSKEAELTTDQKTTFQSVLSAANPEAPQDEAPQSEGTPAPTTPASDNPSEDRKVEASEQKGRFMSEAEIRLLEEKANQGASAFAELENRKLSDRVGKMLFSESNKDGRFFPKQHDAVVNFLKTLSETQRDQFTNIVNNMPKVGLFGEIGTGMGVVTDAYREINDLANEKMKASEGKLSYSEALSQISKENPDLFKRYNDELSAQSN